MVNGRGPSGKVFYVVGMAITLNRRSGSTGQNSVGSIVTGVSVYETGYAFADRPVGTGPTRRAST